MGLRVEAYANIELDDDQIGEVVTANGVEPRDDVDGSVVQFDVNRPAFADRAPGIVPGGWYRYTDSFDFPAGSYSWFGLFRDALSRLIGASSHPAFLEDAARYAEQPFFELLNFSDDKGTIGADVCAKLARDFAENKFSFRRRIDTLAQLTSEHMRKDGNWDAMEVSDIARDFVELYDNFLRAFQIGADSGAVKFA